MATSGMGNYLKGKVFQQVLNNTAYTQPATVDIALGTTAPTDGALTSWVEATTTNYPGYARLNVTPDSDWTISATSAQNNTALNFPTPSGSPTAVIQGFVIYEHGNNNALFWGELTTPQTVNSGGAVSFAIAALTVNLA